MSVINVVGVVDKNIEYDIVVIGLFESTLSLGKYQTEALERFPKFKDEVFCDIVRGDLSIANPTVVKENSKTTVYGFPVATSGRAIPQIRRIHKGLSELKTRIPLEGRKILIYPLNNDQERPNYWLIHVAVRKILLNVKGAEITHYFPENVGPCPFGKEKEPDLATHNVRVWRKERRTRQEELRRFILGESGNYRESFKTAKDFEEDSPK